MIVESAAAKINLALHVIARRADGYHLLDTLVTFADIGDDLTADQAETLTLTVTGPFAAQLGDGDDNLVLQAARALRDHVGPRPGRTLGASLRLTKNLPVASGIGGGSADAAATLRALNRLWALDMPTAILQDIAARLGADIPMCLAAVPVRATGIGTMLADPGALAPLHAVLVNPGVAVPTPAVFANLTRRDNTPMGPMPPGATDAQTLIAYLAACRNDLEAPAIAAAPVIADVLDALRAVPDCRLARMSGSGATCFGLFADRERATSAATNLAAARPGWWVRPTALTGRG